MTKDEMVVAAVGTYCFLFAIWIRWKLRKEIPVYDHTESIWVSYHMSHADDGELVPTITISEDRKRKKFKRVYNGQTHSYHQAVISFKSALADEALKQVFN